MIDALPRKAYLRGMSDWIGIFETTDGLRGWRFHSGAPVSFATGHSPAEITAQLGEADMFIIAPSRSAQKVPLKLLPVGAFTDVQDGPSRLPASVRLQLLGFQSNDNDWDGVALVLTKSHSYWCLLSAQELIGFQAFLTPRLIQALEAPAQSDPDALSETLSRPERLAAHLAASEHKPSAQTGHLIGAELGAARAWWLGQQVAILGPKTLAQGYAAGLTAQGVPVTCHDDPSPLGLVALRGQVG
ncbi:2-dehydro-3-deoxygalactonokinase [Thalassovita sp.]|uniref:2-dehydro-3-deoxygalactonokinase n=1 Tax=Thalassovita sp. TaxID=1979401 RepID=UPI002882290D|nr:2-dehydro-3-deoxygalactonokinase [Thalassovita sp.]MDF1802368.1 2-dehydro-3-deoxygalactonokinase [Thalassovita sp.]